MAAIAFYKLTHSTVDEALPQLLAKTLETGNKAVVCCRGERFTPLSTAIWSRQRESWLPHGIRGRDDDDAGLCPIWITDQADDNGNEASFCFFLDGIEPGVGSGTERVFVLFEDSDGDAVSAARRQWKAFKDGEHDLSYWHQDQNGGWEQAE